MDCCNSRQSSLLDFLHTLLVQHAVVVAFGFDDGRKGSLVQERALEILKPLKLSMLDMKYDKIDKLLSSLLFSFIEKSFAISKPARNCIRDYKRRQEGPS